MHSKKNTVIDQNSGQAFDHNADRYPVTITALRRLVEEADLPEGPIEFIEIHAQASGELTCRVRAPRADETDGVYLAAP